MILTGPQLRAYLPPPLPLLAADASYAVPTQAWLDGKFYPWFWQFRAALGLRVWDRRNDCDNFARACASAAQDCHALTQAGAVLGSPAAAEGVAVGEFWYVAPAGPHAICCAVTDQGLVFFEPQNGRRLHLTQAEILSCTFCRF